ncbi:MAG TPA: UdgX family uracil-DNA binding protein [Methylomirabilota bacterium]|jgi:DNA polymerase|nr:UdgX family uracil-DNA binding protein [Methylomirabilota bacterium]
MATRRRSNDSAASFLPDQRTLTSLREAAAGCKGCELYKRGTQTVFGEGRRTAPMMMVGEQPGNDEDLAGRPFVGPAGRLLDHALTEAGLDRGDIYITNIVKHFKWKPQGKRRIHDKPNASEVEACRPWFQAELELIKPDVLVCLGATAAQAVLGRQFRISAQRGQFVPSPLAPRVFATVHPSSLLRIEDDETRHEETQRLIEEMKLVARAVQSADSSRRHAS